MDAQRYKAIDSLRGFILLNMILYHGLWDVMYMFGVKLDIYTGLPGNIWQKLICSGFILLSGYCTHMSGKIFKRGGIIFLCGGIITAVTLIFMPEEKIIFGILTFMGSAMIITGLLEKFMKKLPDIPGIIIFAALFFLTFNIRKSISYPEMGYIGAFLGFPFKDFVSYDYFPLIPWLFLYFSGYYIYGIASPEKIGLKKSMDKGVFSFMGKNSLIIYMIHQPVVYGILFLIFKACNL